MGEFRINGKTVVIQDGANEPVLGSNVTLESGIGFPSGIFNKLYYNKTSDEVSTTSTTYQDVVSVNVPFDTNKFDYLISWLSPVRKDAVNDGIDMAIKIGSIVVSEVGHRLYGSSTNTYANQEIRTLITSGYASVGSLSVTGCVASYSGTNINTHDNHSTDSGSIIMVFEIWK